MPDTGNIIVPKQLTDESSVAIHAFTDVPSINKNKFFVGSNTGSDTPRNPFLDALTASRNDIAKNEKWFSDTGVTAPAITIPLESVKRYAGSHLYDEVGFSPFDANLEQRYGDRQGALERTGKNLLKFGANTLGAFANSFLVIPNMIGAVAKGDVSGTYDNNATLAISEWTDNLENSLANFTSTYKKEHPFLSYVNPLEWDAFVDNWTGVVKNLGYTVGSIAGAAVQDAAVGLATGGAGLAPMIGMQLSRLGKLAKVVSASDKVGDALNIAVKTGGAVEDAIETASRASKIVNGFRYGLSSFTAAVGEGTFEAAKTYRDVKDSLIDDYRAKNGGLVPTPEDMIDIEKYAKGAGDATLMSNTALLLLTNHLTLGSLLKPTQLAQKQISRQVSNNVSLNLKNLNTFEAVVAPTSKLKGIYNGTIGSTGAKTMVAEGFEEGSQFVISGAATDYYKRAYNAEDLDDTNDLRQSIGRGLHDVLFTTEGMENIIAGALGGKVSSSIRNLINTRRGINSNKLSVADGIVTTLNSQTVTGIWDTTHNGAVTAVSLAKDYRKALESGDIFAAKNLKLQQFFNFVNTGVKAGKFDLRIEQLEQLKDLKEDQFQTLFGIEATSENKATVHEYVDNLINKAQSVKKNIDRINSAFVNPYNQRSNNHNYRVYETYKDQLAISISQVQDNKERLNSLSTEIAGLSAALAVNSAVALTHADGVKAVVKTFTDKIASLRESEDVTTASDLKDNFRKEREFLERKIEALTGNLQAYDADVYLRELSELYQYYSNGESVADDNEFSSLDTLEIHNKAYDIKQLTDASREAQRYYNNLLTGDGMKAEMALISQLLAQDENTISIDENGNFSIIEPEVEQDYASKELGVDTLEDGEDKIDKEDKELIAKILDPENGEDAEAIRSGATPVTTEMKETAKKRLRSEFEEPTTGETTSETPKSDKTKARQEKVKKEMGIVDATDEDTDINDMLTEPGTSRAPKASATPDAGAAIANPVQEDVNATPAEKFWNRFKFSPFKMFNRLLSLNFADTKYKDNLFDVLYSGRLNEVNNLRAEVAPSVKGKSEDDYKKVVYFENQTQKEFNNLYRRGFGTDVNVFAGDTPVGIMHPPTSLVFKRGTEYFTLDQLRDADEYNLVTLNPHNTFEQFKKDFAEYKDAYDKITEGFDGTLKSIPSADFKALFQPVVSFGSTDSSKSASKSTAINKLQYRGKGDAIFSFPLEFNEEKGTYERTSQPTILNAAELSVEEQAEALAYISDNLGRIKSLDVRYIYAMRMPDGRFGNVSTIVARPSDETADNLEEYLSSLKSALNDEGGESIKSRNERLGEAVYIAHGMRRTNMRFAVNKNKELTLSISNKEFNLTKRLVMSAEEVNSSANFEEFLNKVNAKIGLAEQTNRYLKKLDITLSPKSFKKNLRPDQETNIGELEKNLSLSVRPNVFVNAGLTLMPKTASSRLDDVTITAATRPVAATRAGQPVKTGTTWVAPDNTQYKVTKVNKDGTIEATNQKSKLKSVWTGDTFREKVAGNELREVAPPVKVTTTKKDDGTFDVVADGKVVKSNVPAGGVAAEIEKAEKPVAPVTPAVVAPVAAAPKAASTTKPTMETAAPVVDVVNKNINDILSQLKTKGLLQTDC